MLEPYQTVIAAGPHLGVVLGQPCGTQVVYAQDFVLLSAKIPVIEGEAMRVKSQGSGRLSCVGDSGAVIGPLAWKKSVCHMVLHATARALDLKRARV